jgi:hypothetical protein
LEHHLSIHCILGSILCIVLYVNFFLFIILELLGLIDLWQAALPKAQHDSSIEHPSNIRTWLILRF